MPVILCYGDSNTWGAIPGPSDPITGLSKRHPKHQRWTGVLQSVLGEEFSVIEEGVNGRTTSLDPIFLSKKIFTNGLSFFPFVMESHYPIDLVIFMLGTNDTKCVHGQSASQIAQRMKLLVGSVTTSNKNSLQKAPQVLLIAPPPIVTLSDAYPQFDQNSIKISQELSREYQKLASEEKISFLDAGLLACLSKVDGLHLDASQCLLLGRGVGEVVKLMSFT